MAKTKKDEAWESVEVPEKENTEENKVEYEVEAEEKQPEVTTSNLKDILLSVEMKDKLKLF